MRGGKDNGTEGLKRLATSLAVRDVIRARVFLGTATSEEEREELLGMTLSELAQAAQALSSAVYLRQQVEAAEHMRKLTAQQGDLQASRKSLFTS